ncbi:MULTISPECIES: ATP-binding protein [Bacillus cereus group]|uniref:ATP-binding protein n=1 Tax=Bacillus cereus group TaxID=86661 RepID=UPI0018CEEE04|nr:MULTISPECIES: ATP-binding protein [Bacillus cereus group]MCU5596204.1 AAA family ATPase [Bacillus wiedmannii]MEB9532425.1 AAA family ATPase [Bacillus cereus]MEB9724361.1 AAA family ATPase [Bacillus cereus]
MSLERNFPKGILLDSAEKRGVWFEQYVKVEHPIMESIVEDLVERIKNPAGSNLIMVVGPTGVGKTTVQELVVRKIYQWALKREDMDNRIPITGVELPSPELGRFNWKDYYKRVLEALNEPLIDFKVDYDTLKNGDKTTKISPYDKRTSPELRRSLEKAFYYRKPLAFLVDEAQHFSNIANGKTLHLQLDVIKSLANISGVLHILVGHYDLADFINLSGQLSRRVTDIHFARYNANNVDELKHFINVIANLQKQLPLEKEPDLINHYDFIYERTLGCIGILKDWLSRCLVGSLNNGETTINFQSLKKYALPISKIEVMMEEIEKGEDKFNENKDKVSELRIKMGLNKFNVDSVNQVSKNKSRKNVGVRKAKRDAVGR